MLKHRVRAGAFLKNIRTALSSGVLRASTRTPSKACCSRAGVGERTPWPQELFSRAQAGHWTCAQPKGPQKGLGGPQVKTNGPSSCPAQSR